MAHKEFPGSFDRPAVHQQHAVDIANNRPGRPQGTESRLNSLFGINLHCDGHGT